MTDAITSSMNGRDPARKRSGRRGRRTAAIVAALLGTIALGGCAFPVAPSKLVPPARLPVSEVEIASASGHRIRGWYAPGVPGRGAVLLLHGVGTSRLFMAARASFLHDSGFAVLLPDFQAHGQSPGRFATYGKLESLDARAALEFLRRATCGERVGVIGVSMGAAASLLGPGPLAADAMILESVYPTIREATADRLDTWFGPLGGAGRWLTTPVLRVGEWRIGVREEELRPIDRIGKVGAPIFLLAGSADRYTRLAESRALFARAPEPKQLWIIEGAEHEDLHRFARREYERRVGGFLRDHLRRQPGASDHGAARRCSIPASPIGA